VWFLVRKGLKKWVLAKEKKTWFELIDFIGTYLKESVENMFLHEIGHLIGAWLLGASMVYRSGEWNQTSWVSSSTKYQRVGVGFSGGLFVFLWLTCWSWTEEDDEDKLMIIFYAITQLIYGLLEGFICWSPWYKIMTFRLTDVAMLMAVSCSWIFVWPILNTWIDSVISPTPDPDPSGVA